MHLFAHQFNKYYVLQTIKNIIEIVESFYVYINLSSWHLEVFIHSVIVKIASESGHFKEGNYSVILNRLQLEESGFYQCRGYFSDGEAFREVH